MNSQPLKQHPGRTLARWCVPLFWFLAVCAAGAAEDGGPVEPTEAFRTVGLGLAAALAIAFSVMGAGYAVARIGSAALGERLRSSLAYASTFSTRWASRLDSRCSVS